MVKMRVRHKNEWRWHTKWQWEEGEEVNVWKRDWPVACLGILCIKCSCACVFLSKIMQMNLCVFVFVSDHTCVSWLSRTSAVSCITFCCKYTINLFFKTPFLAVWVCLRVVSSLIWKVWSLAFIPDTCQEWLRSVYQTKTVSCHLLKSQIHHPKIS